MKAISLWQPWASLIAAGAKPYETRSWAPPRDIIGQRIGIHAAKKIDKDAASLAEDIMYGQHKAGGFELADKLSATMKRVPPGHMGKFGAAVMPIGVVVCTARIVGAFQVGEQSLDAAVPAAKVVRSLTMRPFPDCFTVRYDDFGNYEPGRWAWLLEEVQVLQPSPAVVGKQGIFDLPQGWLV